jgi:hypothetical protein
MGLDHRPYRYHCTACGWTSGSSNVDSEVVAWGETHALGCTAKKMVRTMVGRVIRLTEDVLARNVSGVPTVSQHRATIEIPNEGELDILVPREVELSDLYGRTVSVTIDWRKT